MNVDTTITWRPASPTLATPAIGLRLVANLENREGIRLVYEEPETGQRYMLRISPDGTTRWYSQEHPSSPE